MTNPAGSVNRSKTGRWSDSKLPSGRSDPIPQGQRIVETLDSVAASFPQPPGPADEIIWVTQSLPNAILNTQYAAQLQAISPISGLPVQFALVSGSFPPSLALDQGDGQITGSCTEHAGSPYTCTIRAFLPDTNIKFIDKTFTISVTVLSIPIDPGYLEIVTASPLPSATNGLTYKTALIGYSTSGGTLSWSVHPDSVLPNDLTLEPADGHISGMCNDSPGDYLFKINLDDGINPTQTKEFQLTILDQQQGQIVITINNTLPNAVENQIYAVPISYAGNTSQITATMSGNPSGLEINPSTALISGVIPTGNSGTYSITVTISSSTDLPATTIFTLVVLPVAPTLTVSNISNLTAGQTLIVDWSITDPLTYTPGWQLYVLVDGTVIGQLSATPTNLGGGSWRLTQALPVSLPATSGIVIGLLETVSQVYAFSNVFTLSAYPAITFITASPLPNATVGSAYSQSVVASGGLAALAYSATGLPGTLTMNGAGAITGTPVVASNYTVAVQATDGITTAFQNYTLLVDGAGAITITTPSPVPTGTVGVAYSQTFTATGNSGPITWSEGAGDPPGISVNPATGVHTGTPTVSGTYTWDITADDGIATPATKQFTIVIEPAIGNAVASIEMRNGQYIHIFEGDDITYTHGSQLKDSQGNLTSQTLVLNATSENAPNGSPGIHVQLFARHLRIRNKGLAFFSGAAAGQPIFFRSLTANLPGRVPQFGEEYLGAVNTSGNIWELIRRSDPKHPIGTTSGLAAFPYSITAQEHCLDGGESIYYRLVLTGDQMETALVPGAGAIANALTVLNPNTTLVSTWPLFEHLLNLNRHDPATYNVSTTPIPQRTASWMTKFDNLISLSQFNSAGISATNPPGDPYRKWHGGMYNYSPVDLAGNMLRPCYYFSDFYYGYYFLTHTSDTSTLAYFLALYRRKVASGFVAMDSAHSTKNMWRGETSGSIPTSFPSGAPNYQLMKCGFGGAIQAPHYEKTNDESTVVAYMLRPDDELIADTFNRRTTQLTAITPEFAQNGSSGTGVGGSSLRTAGHFLRSLLWFYRAHTILGNAATAATLKAKAETYLGQMFTAIDLSATCPNGTSETGQGNPVMFPPRTTTPAIHPYNVPNMGIREGFHLVATKWIVDEGLHPSRLAYWKLMVKWYLEKCHNVRPNGTIEMAYNIYINMSGGGATWNGPPLIYAAGQGPAPTAPSFHNYFHASWDLGLEPYMTSWYPGAVAPYGLTWAQFFTQMAKMGFENPNTNWPGFSIANCGASHSGNGALSADIWNQKTKGHFCAAIFG